MSEKGLVDSIGRSNISGIAYSLKLDNWAKIKIIYLSPYSTDPIKSRWLNFFFTHWKYFFYKKPDLSKFVFIIPTSFSFNNYFDSIDHQHGRNTGFLISNFAEISSQRVEVVLISEFTFVLFNPRYIKSIIIYFKRRFHSLS